MNWTVHQPVNEVFSHTNLYLYLPGTLQRRYSDIGVSFVKKRNLVSILVENANLNFGYTNTAQRESFKCFVIRARNMKNKTIKAAWIKVRTSRRAGAKISNDGSLY